MGFLYRVGWIGLGLCAVCSAAASVVPDAALRYSAGADTNGNAVWENLGAESGYDWTLAAGVQRTPSDPAPSLPGVDAAWIFPGGALPAGGTASPLDPFSTGSGTFELWFRPDAPGDASARQVLWETGGDIGASLVRDGTNLVFTADDGASNAAQGATLAAALSASPGCDDFIHAAGVIDRAAGEGGTLRLYLNGEPAGSAALPTNFADWCGSSYSGLGTIAQSTSPYETDQAGHLGGNDLLGGNAAVFEPFAGQIAEVRFYARALSDGEIRRNYEAARPADPSIPQPGRPPNFIFIFCDDLGWNDLGCYTYPDKDNPGPPPAPYPNPFTNLPPPNPAYAPALPNRTLTPHLDQLADEGIRFTSFYASENVCSPSRAGLMTGCYPARVGITQVLNSSSTAGLNTAETTLAEQLRTAGYATACVGKWHLGHHRQFLPTRQGFDEYFGLPYSNDMSPLYLYENETTNVTFVGNVGTNQAQLTGQYTARALDFIERNREQPFFLYLAHSMPHIPVYASEAFAGASGISSFYDVVMEIDWSVGQILAKLQDLGLDGNTLVMFSSDNGPWLRYSSPDYASHAVGSAYPLRDSKSTTWEGGHRVPFLARWPGRIPAGLVSGEIACNLDIFPTLSRLAGAPDRTVDGRDLWSVLEGGARDPASRFFYYDGASLQAVRDGDWKLRDTGTPTLFNLAADIQELSDIAASNPAVVAQLNDTKASFAAALNAGKRPAGALSAQEIVLSTDRVFAAEGQVAAFGVKLLTAPTGSVTVAVRHAAGDPGIAVEGASTLTFTPSDWDVFQTVAVRAGEDPDTLDRIAVLRCSSPDFQPVREVYVTGIDNDTRPGPVARILQPTVREVSLAGTDSRLLLEGRAEVNEVPDPEGATSAWSGSGAATPVFEDAAARITGVQFPALGIYTVQLAAVYGGSTGTAQRIVRVGLDAPLPAGDLEARLPMDEESGAIAADRTGRGHDGAVSGAAAWHPDEGRLGGALAVGGGDDRVTIPDSADINLMDVSRRTVALWFRANGTGTVSGTQVLYEEGGTTYGLNLALVEGRLCVGGWNNGLYGWTSTYATGGAAVAGGAWHHAALVLEATNSLSADGVRGYLDGLPATSGPAAMLASHTDDIGVGGIAQNTRISDGSVAVAGTHGFAGMIDELLIYNRALDDAEVAILATGPVNRAPVAEAGPDQAVAYSAGAVMAGAVTDDGLPGPGSVTQSWVQAEGPGFAALAAPTSLVTHVAFDLPGLYRLRLIAGDGEYAVYDDLDVTVAPLTFAEWIAGQGVPAGLDGAEDDPDGDRMVNFFEFGVGLQAAVSNDAMQAVRYAFAPVPGGTRVTAWFDQPMDRAPTCFFETTLDLAAWTNKPSVRTAVELSNRVERIFHDLEFADEVQRQFIRTGFRP